MSDKPQSSHRSTDGPSAERVVIRDKRKIDVGTGKGRQAKHRAEPPDVAENGADTGTAEREAGPAATASAEAEAPDTSGAAPASAEPAGSSVSAEQVGSSVSAESAGSPASAESVGTATPAGATVEEAPAGGGLGAELAALRTELEERTRDLQRVSAEYANYRKRVDRDRGVAAEQTTGTVLSTLLPILDDLDRAREHGDLVGPFASVAEQLSAALGKFGLTGFGEKGDPFDPTRHEAVAHLTSAEVSKPTCVDVLRRGYLLGERLLRPAMVAVADPE